MGIESEENTVKVALELIPEVWENKSGDIQEQGFLGKGNSQCKALKSGTKIEAQ